MAKAFQNETFVSADSYPDTVAETFLSQAARGEPLGFSPPLSKRGDLVPVRDVMYLRDTPERVKLRRPLKLQVLPTDEGRFEVFAPALDLGGVGDSLEGAAQDLVSTMVGFSQAQFNLYVALGNLPVAPSFRNTRQVGE